MIDVVLKLALQYGLFPALAVYLIYKQGKDNEALAVKLHDVELFCRTTLMSQLNDNAKVIEANTEVIRHCKKNTEQKVDMLLQESRH
jgi:hypothetical protein